MAVERLGGSGDRPVVTASAKSMRCERRVRYRPEEAAVSLVA